MRNLVIGIIAVLCLELGFTTYITTRERVDTWETMHLAVNEPVSEERAIYRNDLAFFDSDEPVLAGSSEMDRPDRVIRYPSAVAAKRAKYRTPVSSRKTPTQTKVYAQKRPSPVKVTVPDPDDLFAIKRSDKFTVKNELTSDLRMDSKLSSDKEVRAPSRSGKRSLIASAMPVFKKPVSWIRSIGSKIF